MPLRIFDGTPLPVCYICLERTFTKWEWRRLSVDVNHPHYRTYACNPRANATRSRLCVLCLCRVSQPEQCKQKEPEKDVAEPLIDLTAEERCQLFNAQKNTREI
eukprot:1686458-Rhodomonas_salina.1